MTELGRRFVECFVAAMDDAGLPDDQEFRDAMRAYMEWAVGEILPYGSVDPARVTDGHSMPRWSWDGHRAAQCERELPASGTRDS